MKVLVEVAMIGLPVISILGTYVLSRPSHDAQEMHTQKPQISSLIKAIAASIEDTPDMWQDHYIYIASSDYQLRIHYYEKIDHKISMISIYDNNSPIPVGITSEEKEFLCQKIFSYKKNRITKVQKELQARIAQRIVNHEKPTQPCHQTFSH